jgi:NTE family protein
MGILNFLKSKRGVKPRKIRPQKPVKYNAGLVLSGGSARGMAHIGAIKAFEEHGIQFRVIAGTSAGSMVGALYAAGFSADEIRHFATGMKERDIINSRLFFIPSKSSNMENALKKVMGDMTFSDLKTPFAAVAVDVRSGEEIVLREGSVARAVSASCAVPGVFTPVEWEPYRLIDGGVINTIPSDVARAMGANTVIAVDVNSKRGYGTPSPKIIDILKAAFRIAMKSTALKGIMNSDIIIEPDLQKFKSTKLSGAEQMIDLGYQAAIEKMDEIKELLGIKPKARAGEKLYVGGAVAGDFSANGIISGGAVDAGAGITDGDALAKAGADANGVSENGADASGIITDIAADAVDSVAPEPYSEAWFNAIEPDGAPDAPAVAPATVTPRRKKFFRRIRD